MEDNTIDSTELTPIDRQTLHNFVRILNDVGVQATIMLRVVVEFLDHSDVAIRIYDGALQDIVRTCDVSNDGNVVAHLEQAWQAAPSIALIAKLMCQCDGIPLSYVPSGELVKKLQRKFYHD